MKHLDRMKQRADARRKRMVGNVALTHQDADDWDLAFWQQQTPQARLSALVALRKDLEAVRGSATNLDWDDE